MNASIILGLLQNTAILLAFALIYDYFWAAGRKRNLLVKILHGTVIGGFGIVLILTPWTYVPGLFFDTRSVILSISGLFFGPVPTLIAMLITGCYRLMAGGPGTLMGLAVILTSGLAGILWRKLRPRWRDHGVWQELLGLGLLVHVIMLGCTLLLPAKMIIPTLTTVAFPVLVIYPSATMLLGSLMNRRLLNWKTRESLAESEQRWKFALEGAGDGVWDWNVEKGEIYYSPKWKSMLGYEDRDIPNDLKVWDELLFPDDLAPANAEIEKHLKGETPVYTHIHRLRCKDGTYRWILDRGKVMQRDEQGRALRFIGTHTDISGRIESEKELKAAKEKAEESDRLKLSFLNNISHEVRTPLNAIMGFSEILDDEQDPESRKKYIRTIRSNSEQLLGIITDVLDFSRLESEDIRIETQKFSLRDIFYDLFETMKPAALKAGLAFTVSPESSTIDSEFLGDRNKIRQVMISLISNAIKYTSEGSVEIGWKTGAGGVRFFVRDTGIGIDSELKSKVFERFYRAPSAQKLAVRGAGLGLSISKQLVDMMGGTIGTMPNEPRGSVFFMVLPLLPWIPLPVEEENTDSLKSLSDLHILIAEDEDANYELLQVLLRRQCRVVERAFNGEDVIEKVQRTRPDLILMDIKMPVLDGLEATRRIRSNNFQGPIIAVTAYSQPEEKKLAEEAGCNHFLSKPINKSKLLDLLENAIRQ